MIYFYLMKISGIIQAMEISKNGRTYKNFKIIEKIWGGTRLANFVRRWKDTHKNPILFKKK